MGILEGYLLLEERLRIPKQVYCRVSGFLKLILHSLHVHAVEGNKFFRIRLMSLRG